MVAVAAAVGAALLAPGDLARDVPGQGGPEGVAGPQGGQTLGEIEMAVK